MTNSGFKNIMCAIFLSISLLQYGCGDLSQSLGTNIIKEKTTTYARGVDPSVAGEVYGLGNTKSVANIFYSSGTVINRTTESVVVLGSNEYDNVYKKGALLDNNFIIGSYFPGNSNICANVENSGQYCTKFTGDASSITVKFDLVERNHIITEFTMSLLNPPWESSVSINPLSVLAFNISNATGWEFHTVVTFINFQLGLEPNDFNVRLNQQQKDYIDSHSIVSNSSDFEISGVCKGKLTDFADIICNK